MNDHEQGVVKTDRKYQFKKDFSNITFAIPFTELMFIFLSISEQNI